MIDFSSSTLFPRSASGTIPAPTPPAELPPMGIREILHPKQFARVEKSTRDVRGWHYEVTPPEDTDEFLFVEISPPFSSTMQRRPSPTATLRHRAGSEVQWEEDASLDVQRERAIEAIDAAGEALRMAVITRLTQTPEYQRAEQHAREYRAAGYPEGEDAYVPPGVSSWAMAKWREGWTYRQAADDILATADRWYGILDDIRALRLTNKEDVRNADTPAAITAICADMDADMAVIGQQLRHTLTS